MERREHSPIGPSALLEPLLPANRVVGFLIAHPSLPRRHRAERSPNGAGFMPRPRRIPGSSTGVAGSLRPPAKLGPMPTREASRDSQPTRGAHRRACRRATAGTAHSAGVRPRRCCANRAGLPHPRAARAQHERQPVSNQTWQGARASTDLGKTVGAQAREAGRAPTSWGNQARRTWRPWAAQHLWAA
jgi:hypothetical protein